MRPRPAGTCGRRTTSNLAVDISRTAGTTSARTCTCLAYADPGMPLRFTAARRRQDEARTVGDRWWFAHGHVIGDVR